MKHEQLQFVEGLRRTARAKANARVPARIYDLWKILEEFQAEVLQELPYAWHCAFLFIYKKKVISGQYVAALAENTQHEELLKL